ncbi:hypothetical protein ILUMI_24792 [Ignelater luminosus]|uniref:Uncharacterized protein n=1 Tax=Ignelater luminosus TaxID=2038154 RepID=A0A8K0C6G5_IGNLU|nr:hypothetical protein ILUMI_24792 [Ignelater luminosus]
MMNYYELTNFMNNIVLMTQRTLTFLASNLEVASITNHFKLCTNASVDITYDLLEGILQLEIKYITGTEVNERLQSFNFGIIDRCNKPSQICADKPGHLIGQRAAQTLCLIQYFPLISSDIVSVLPIECTGKYSYTVANSNNSYSVLPYKYNRNGVSIKMYNQPTS